MRARALPPELLEQVAVRFKALGEPVRLQMLGALRAGELSVNELVGATGLGQANVSKHLQLLYALGLVRRRQEGSHVYYALADGDIFRMCDIMCGRLESRADRYSPRSREEPRTGARPGQHTSLPDSVGVVSGASGRDRRETATARTMRARTPDSESRAGRNGHPRRPPIVSGPKSGRRHRG